MNFTRTLAKKSASTTNAGASPNVQKFNSKRVVRAYKTLRIRRNFSFCSVDINDYLSALKNKRYEKGS
ncbi:MAG: hypothetical protein LBH34_01720 [Prevotellaceae bacterium]|nr:hypothetical protein [Prevotellaceae bacterium]